MNRQENYLETILIIGPTGKEEEVTLGKHTVGCLGEFEQTGDSIRFIPAGNARRLNRTSKTIAALFKREDQVRLISLEGEAEIYHPGFDVKRLNPDEEEKIYGLSSNQKNARIGFGDATFNLTRLSRDDWVAPELSFMTPIHPEALKPITDNFEGRDRLTPFLEQVFQEMRLGGAAEYALAYAAKPLETINRENSVLAKNDRLPTILLAQELLELQRTIEKSLFPQQPTNPTPETYRELTNVWILANGDMIPGTGFELGRPETYHEKRELLCLSTDSPLVRECLLRAKLSAINAKRDGTNVESLAEATFIEFAKMYSPKPGPKYNFKETEDRCRTIGGFMKTGGDCRHRAAALTAVYQKGLGITARYVRGKLIGGRAHAWVTVHENSLRQANLLADPNLESQYADEKNLARGLFRRITPLKIDEDFLNAASLNIGSLRGTWYFNHKEPDEFNRIWRPANTNNIKLDSQ